MSSPKAVADLIPVRPRDLLILTVLADGPVHGYGIVTGAQDQFGDDVALDPANLYRSLKRLIRDGVVTEAIDESRQRNRSYALTELGERVLALEVARLRRLAAVAEAAQGRSPEPA